jgi:hypothetical protein
MHVVIADRPVGHWRILMSSSMGLERGKRRISSFPYLLIDLGFDVCGNVVTAPKAIGYRDARG